jgi:hypothetical protein
MVALSRNENSCARVVSTTVSAREVRSVCLYSVKSVQVSCKLLFIPFKYARIANKIEKRCGLNLEFLVQTGGKSNLNMFAA